MKRTANQIAAHNEVQYHIGCKSGDVAKNIILVGDPQRAFRISQQFGKIDVRRLHREYVTYTGLYKGFPLSVMATGIGQGNMEIAMIEISQIVSKPTIIRCGTSSGLQKNIQLGDMVISKTVYDLGNVSSYYKVVAENVKANAKIEKALERACKELGLAFHAGKTASAPGFYGPQGRQIKGFPIKNQKLISNLTKKKVLNLEMEVATLFSLASLKKIPVGAVCSAIGNRVRNDFMNSIGIMTAEKNSIQCVLKAFEILSRSNRIRLRQGYGRTKGHK